MNTKSITSTPYDVTTYAAQLTLATFVMCLIAQPVFAGTAGTYSALGSLMCNIIGIAYGNVGRGLAVIGVITLGAGALVGKVSWGMALTVAIAVSLIFGAHTVVNGMGISLKDGDGLYYCRFFNPDYTGG